MRDDPMILTLRVETALGGRTDLPPLVLDRRGATVGRRQGMDWVLPDPEERISRHHFDIEFADGAYWVTDRSTNGTFANAPQTRIERPHRLRDGDRLFVGHYVIAVALASADRTVFTPSAPDRASGSSRPVSARPLGTGLQLPGAPAPGTALVTPPRFGPAPSQRPGIPVGLSMPPAMAAMGSVAGPPPFSTQAPVRADPAPVPDLAGQAVLAAFCEGADLPVSALAGTDPQAVARMTGQALRLLAEHLLAIGEAQPDLMLHQAPRNPLLRFPTAGLALEAVFLRPQEGWQTGPTALADALRVAVPGLRRAGAPGLGAQADDTILQGARKEV